MTGSLFELPIYYSFKTMTAGDALLLRGGDHVWMVSFPSKGNPEALTTTTTTTTTAAAPSKTTTTSAATTTSIAATRPQPEAPKAEFSIVDVFSVAVNKPQSSLKVKCGEIFAVGFKVDAFLKEPMDIKVC